VAVQVRELLILPKEGETAAFGITCCRNRKARERVGHFCAVSLHAEYKLLVYDLAVAFRHFVINNWEKAQE